MTGGPAIGFGDGEFKDIEILGGGPLTADWQPILSMDPNPAGHINFEIGITFLEPQQLSGVDVLEGLRRFLFEAREIVAKFD